MEVVTYSDQHDRRWPKNMDELARIFKDPIGVKNLKNPATGDTPGYEYVAPFSPVRNPAHTVVMIQLRDGKRDLSLAVGFADTRVDEYDPATDVIPEPQGPVPPNENAAAPVARSDESLIQGTWHITKCHREGSDFNPKVGHDVTFNNRDFSGLLGESNIEEGGVFNLVSGKKPKEIQLFCMHLEKGATVTALKGYYSIDADKLVLRISIRPSPSPAPENLSDSQPDDGWEVLTLERKKD